MTGGPASPGAAGSGIALSLEEQASLLSGADMATTAPIERIGLPAVVMTDGPHGLAMNLPDFAGKVRATAFPTAANLAATWNPRLVEAVGEAIAVAAREAGANVLLGPGLNIKRSPLGGRNFEYYSEDPLVSGRMGAAFVRGVQKTGVSACPKHFAVNSQETDRMRVSAEVSERALREIYLSGFEQVVTEARPRSIMASYNRINGVPASENPWLLTTVLREEWGFEGAVVSDWGAVGDRLAALRAGLDLEMPGTNGASAELVLDAVEAGTLDEAVIGAAAGRIAALARSLTREPAAHREADEDALALEAALQSIVLLRNDGVLPLAGGSDSVVVVGALAERPRFQGGGSSQVNDEVAENLLTALPRAGITVTAFAPGYSLHGEADTARLLDEVRSATAGAELVVAVVGLEEQSDSEGRDRVDLALPAAQREALAVAAGSGARLVVVCFGGGVLTVDDFAGDADAVLWAGLPGRRGSTALAAILTGAANPSGKLTETIPLSLASTPTFLSFPGEDGTVHHGEGIFVGYRGYDASDTPVAYPFGHGLGYTSFRYDDIELRLDRDADRVTAVFTVTNSGARPGAEVAQVYVGQPEAGVARARRQLADFVRLELDPGQSERVALTLPRRAFERWSERAGGWVRDAGRHRIDAGASSRDLRLTAWLDLDATGPVPPLTTASTLREWMTDPAAGTALLARVREELSPEGTLGLLTNEHVLLMIGDLPIGRLAADRGNVLTHPLLEAAADDVNSRRRAPERPSGLR
ncbi:glycoside hydrolase family 3 N-terminal domain-containing protein [Herbiconiux sp. 11R-BC]|uniref:glycoside hydrolase family 3 N-terminal domain-containing protein n=1 Tax=Herbiconiux sp. 11R-BC TaxID=3111637 RepID=UPI003C0BB900